MIRQGNLQYILTVAMAPDAIEAILNEAGAPADWVGVVLDASGHVLAHTRSEGEQLGQVASLTLRGAIAPNTADFHIGFTPQGLQVETVARILPNTGGWTVAFGIPAATLRQPVRRALFLLAAACLASLALSAAMAVLLTRDMNQRRDDERSRAERALRASEERRAMAIEAAELGSWRWDIASDQFDGSERCLLMLELSPAAHGAAWQEVMAAVHPDDCGSLGCAVQECLTGRGHFCAEFRVEQRDGGQRWVRATGRLLAGENDQPDSLQGVMDNITARKRAEAERLDLLRRLAQAQEEERGRISRDLHDQVGQTVTGLSLSLKALEQEDGISPAHVHALQELVAGISRDIHRAAADLRPSALDDLGLLRALRALAANIADAAGIRIDVQALGYERRLSSEIETIIYRLVQESLTNILKHAHAHAVSVLLDHTAQEIRVIVEDDGIGFNVAAQADSSDVSHIGLSGMRERLALIGGSMMIEIRHRKRNDTIHAGANPRAERRGKLMTQIRVALVDDHPVVLAGVSALLRTAPEVMLVGEAATGKAAIRMIASSAPDIAVMDISLPDINGIDLAVQLAETSPAVKLLALSVHEDRAYVQQLLLAGAKGYLLKRSAAEELVRAVRVIAEGDMYLDPAIVSKAISDNSAGETAGGAQDSLSSREQDVLRFIAQGFSNKEIAARLQISTKSVETYKARAADKLSLRTRADIVRYGVAQGWLQQL